MASPFTSIIRYTLYLLLVNTLIHELYMCSGVQVDSFLSDHSNNNDNVTSFDQITDPIIQFSDVNLKLVVVDVTLVTDDFTLNRLGDLDIHRDDNYVPIEFAGTITALAFSVSADTLAISCHVMLSFLLFSSGST